MSFLSRLFGNRKQVKKANIVILGPSGAGKTTLVKYLETGKPVEEEVLTTLGIDYRDEPVNIDDWKFKIIDVGGQTLYQKTFWSLGVQQADGVVYVIDSLVKGDNGLEKAIKQFKYMKNLLDPVTPLLILVNKQDLIAQDPLNAEQAFELYNMKNLAQSMNLVGTSAKYGDGVQIAFQWMIEKLDNRMAE